MRGAKPAGEDVAERQAGHEARKDEGRRPDAAAEHETGSIEPDDLKDQTGSAGEKRTRATAHRATGITRK